MYLEHYFLLQAPSFQASTEQSPSQKLHEKRYFVSMQRWSVHPPLANRVFPGSSYMAGGIRESTLSCINLPHCDNNSLNIF